MNVLVIGSPEFHRFVQDTNRNHFWDLTFASSREDLEDLALTGLFQGVFIDIDDESASERGVALSLDKLQSPFVTIGFSDTQLGTRHEAYLSGFIDVCFQKSARQSLLRMQCNAVIRLAQGNKSSQIQIGNITLDVDSRFVSVMGKRVALSRREYQLLELLFLNAGRIVTVERFLNYAYGYEEVPEFDSFKVLVWKIRRKLANAGVPSDFVETRRGQGYSIPLSQPASLKVAA